MASTLNNDDHDTLLTIQNLLDGNVWDEETIEEVARILHEAGYEINDIPA